MENDQQATKQDLKSAISELKQWILERELAAIRWFTVLQITYFSITLAAVWFMVNQQNNHLLEQFREIVSHLAVK